jgi:hypothetical protein
MEGFSLRWFIKLAQNESIIEAFKSPFKNSLILGSLTAVISTGIGIMAALAFIRFRVSRKKHPQHPAALADHDSGSGLRCGTVVVSALAATAQEFRATADRARGADLAVCPVDRSGPAGGHQKRI